MSRRNAGLAIYKGQPVGRGRLAGHRRSRRPRRVCERSSPSPAGASAAPAAAASTCCSGIAVCGKCGHTMGSATAVAAGVYVCKHVLVSPATWRASTSSLWGSSWAGCRPGRGRSADRREARRYQRAAGQGGRAAEPTGRGGRAVRRRRHHRVTAEDQHRETAAALAEVESKMLDANKSRVFDGVIGARTRGLCSTGCRWTASARVIDLLITVTILPTGRAGRGFDPASVRVEWRSSRWAGPRSTSRTS